MVRAITVIEVAVLVCALLLQPGAAFFDQLSQGQPGVGCAGEAPAATEVDLPTVPPSTTLIAFAGESHAGKTFVAKRLNSLLRAHSEWNITSEIFSLDSYPLVDLAREAKLDQKRLIEDLDYRDEHYSLISAHRPSFAAAHPNWRKDALDWFLAAAKARAATAAHARSVLIVDDLSLPFQLEYLQRVVDQQQVPNAKLIPVLVEASTEARKRRGLRPSAVAPEGSRSAEGLTSTWSFRVANERDGADQVAAIDTFLAERLLRTVVE